MTDVEKKAAEEAAKKGEDIKKLTEEIDTLKKSLNNVVDELKGERKTKQEIEAKLTLAEMEMKKIAGKGGDGEGGNLPNVTEEIQKELGKRDLEQTSKNRQSAEERFKKAHPEFSPENDAGGIKFAAFQAKLKRLNDTGLKTTDEFLELQEDALGLLTKESSGKNYNPYASMPNSSGGNPPIKNDDGLTPKEERLTKSLGWDPKRYLKQKASKPAYVGSLLENFEKNV